MNSFITFKELNGIPSLLFVGDDIVYRGFFNMRDSVLNGTREDVFRFGLFAVCRFDRKRCGKVYSVSLECRDLNDLTSELFAKLFNIYSITAFPDTL